MHKNSMQFENIDAAVPLVKPRITGGSGQGRSSVSAQSFHHHTASGLAPTTFVQAGQDLVYALSNGMVFCYDGLKGTTRWFAQTKAKWDASQPRAPAVELFSSHVNGEPDMILVVGERSLSLLSADEGAIQAQRKV